MDVSGFLYTFRQVPAWHEGCKHVRRKERDPAYEWAQWATGAGGTGVILFLPKRACFMGIGLCLLR